VVNGHSGSERGLSAFGPDKAATPQCACPQQMQKRYRSHYLSGIYRSMGYTRHLLSSQRKLDLQVDPPSRQEFALGSRSVPTPRSTMLTMTTPHTMSGTLCARNRTTNVLA
jgi:hypothetical protein